MEYSIENSLFKPFGIQGNGYFYRLHGLMESLTLKAGLSIYFRGGLLENPEPHSQSDLDLFIIHDDPRDLKWVTGEIHQRLSCLGRPIDLHCLTRIQLDNDVPQRLLFHTRSLLLIGDRITVDPVKADRDMVLRHWERYDPSLPPGIMYSSTRSRVSALKNLTRCFGLINLIENYVFSREIDDCLSYAEKKDGVIHDLLRRNWSIVDYREPMMLEDIKRYLLKHRESFESKRSADLRGST